jgi:hypothetical protein
MQSFLKKLLDTFSPLYTNQKNYFWYISVLAILLNVLVWYLWQTRIVEGLRYVYSPIVLENIDEEQIQYLIPFLGSLFSGINLFLALVTLRKAKLAAYFLAGGTVLIQILILILIRFYLRS